MSVSQYKLSHGRKQPDGHIRRPRNAFILYRSDFVAKSKLTKGTECDHRKISKIVGQIWNNLSAEEKAPWERKALEEKEAHRLKYPDYRYTPQYSRKPGDGGIPPPTVIRRKTNPAKLINAASEDARCKTIAKLVMEGTQGEDLERVMAQFDSGAGARNRADEAANSARLLQSMIPMDSSQSPSPPPHPAPLAPLPPKVPLSAMAFTAPAMGGGHIGTRRRSVSTPTPIPAHLLHLQPAVGSPSISHATRPSHVRASSTDEYIPRIARSSRPGSPLVGAPRTRKTRTLAISMREAAARFSALSNAGKGEGSGDSRPVDSLHSGPGFSMIQTGDLDYGTTPSSSTFTSPRSFQTEDLAFPDFHSYSLSPSLPSQTCVTDLDGIIFPSLESPRGAHHQFSISYDVSIPLHNTHSSHNTHFDTTSHSHSTTQDMCKVDAELQQLQLLQQKSTEAPNLPSPSIPAPQTLFETIMTGTCAASFGAQTCGTGDLALSRTNSFGGRDGELGTSSVTNSMVECHSMADETMFGIDGGLFSICVSDMLFPEPYHPSYDAQQHDSKLSSPVGSVSSPAEPATNVFANDFTFPLAASSFPSNAVSTLDTNPVYKHPLIFTQPLSTVAATTGLSSSCPSDWLVPTGEIDWQQWVNGEDSQVDGEGEPESVVQSEPSSSTEDIADLQSYRLGMELAWEMF